MLFFCILFHFCCFFFFFSTEADLRRLTEKFINALMNFGLSLAEINRMHRWERVRAVARSTEASRVGQNLSMRRFQRNIKQSLQAQISEFKKHVNKIFEKQLKMLEFRIYQTMLVRNRKCRSF